MALAWVAVPVCAQVACGALASWWFSSKPKQTEQEIEAQKRIDELEKVRKARYDFDDLICTDRKGVFSNLSLISH